MTAPDSLKQAVKMLLEAKITNDGRIEAFSAFLENAFNCGFSSGFDTALDFVAKEAPHTKDIVDRVRAMKGGT